MNAALDIVATSKAIVARHPSSLTADELATVLDAGETLDSFLKLARAEAERRLESSQPVTGWELAPGRKRTSVMDTAAAFRSLAPLLTERAFLDCCSAALGKLTDAVRAAEGVTEDEAKDVLGDYLKGNLMTSDGAPTLKPIPKTIAVAAIAKEES